MFVTTNSANLRHDKATNSDMPVVELVDANTIACAVISTVTSRRIRHCTCRTDPVLSVAQISKRNLAAPMDQDKACAVCDRNDPLSVCDTVL